MAVKKDLSPPKGFDDAESFIKTMATNIGNWFSYWSRNIENAKFGSRFLCEQMGQWPEEVKRAFRAKNKALFQANYLEAQKKHLFGLYKSYIPTVSIDPIESPAAINDDPMDAERKKQTDKVVEQLVRSHINSPKAEKAYDACVTNVLQMGFGVLGVEIEKEAEGTFNKTVSIYNLEDPIRAFFDPSVKDEVSMTRGKGQFAGVHAVTSKKEFEKKYPDAEVPTADDLARLGFGYSSPVLWINDKEVGYSKIAYREHERKTLYKLSNGVECFEGEAQEILKKNKTSRRKIKRMNEMAEFGQMLPLPPALSVKRKEDVEVSKITLYTITAREIIDKQPWYSGDLPYKLVLGDYYYDPLNGLIYTKWFGQDAKSLVELSNYAVTLSGNALKQGTFSKWLVPKSIVSQKDENERNYYMSMLEDATNDSNTVVWDDSDPTGKPPIQLPPMSVSPVYEAMIGRTKAQIESITGVNEAMMGRDESELSGVAIEQKLAQASKVNFDSLNNLYKAIEEIGEQVVSLLPIIYNETRQVFITGKDGTRQSIFVNKTVGDRVDGNPIIENELANLKYSVQVTLGSSFAMQKTMVLASLFRLASLNPQFSTMLADQIAAELDVPNKQQIISRLQTVLPPQIAQEEGIHLPPAPPDPRVAVAQQQMQLQQNKLSVEQQKIQAEERKTQSDLIKNHIETQADLQRTAAKTHAETTKARHDTLQTILETHKTATETNAVELGQENDRLKQLLRGLLGI